MTIDFKNLNIDLDKGEVPRSNDIKCLIYLGVVEDNCVCNVKNNILVKNLFVRGDNCSSSLFFGFNNDIPNSITVENCNVPNNFKFIHASSFGFQLNHREIDLIKVSGFVRGKANINEMIQSCYLDIAHLDLGNAQFENGEPLHIDKFESKEIAELTSKVKKITLPNTVMSHILGDFMGVLNPKLTVEYKN